MQSSVTEILDYYKIENEPAQDTDELSFLCPFHDDRSLGSAFFNESTRLWYCFSCGKGGNDVQFVSRMEKGCSYNDAKVLIDTSFTGLKDYNKEFQSGQASRIDESDSVSWREFMELRDAITLRSLETLSKSTISVKGFSKWLKVLCWIHATKKAEVQERHKQIFNVYDQLLIFIQKEAVHVVEREG